MIKYYIFLILTLMILKSNSQLKNEFCHNSFQWDDFELTEDKLSDSCSKVLVVTNRPYNSDNSEELLPNKLAKDKNLSYLTAGCDGKKWNLRLVEDFNKGISDIDNGRNIVLFIHGNGKTLPEALTRAHRIQAKYNVSVILFDWPSKYNMLTKSVRMLRKCNSNFLSLLKDLSNYKKHTMKPEQNLSIIAHSLGNFYFTQLIKSGKINELDEKFVDNLLLNSPGIKAKGHSRLISKLKIQKNLYITLNKNDFVLRGAQMITARRMLGNVMVNESADNAEYIHFTDVADKLHTYFVGYHEFEFDNPAVVDFYFNALNGNKIVLDNQKFYQPRENGDGYNIKKY